MVLQVLEVRIRPGATVEPIREQTIARFAGGAEQRAAVLSRTLHRYVLPIDPDLVDLEVLEAFLEARGWGLEAFLWKDHRAWRHRRQDVVLATGDGAATTYALPTTGAYGGDYIDDTAPFGFEVAGAPVAGVTVDRDARTITFGAAPTGSITGTYEYFRRFKFGSGTSIADPLQGIYPLQLELIEAPLG